MKLSELSQNPYYTQICELVELDNPTVFVTFITFSKQLMQQTSFEVQTQESILTELSTEERTVTQEDLFNEESTSKVLVADDVTTLSINFLNYKDLDLIVPYIFIYTVV